MPDSIVVKLHPGTKAPNLKQYPLNRHSKKGINPLITTFLKCQLIGPRQSPYNTPILLIQKPGARDYRFVQDLKAINQTVRGYTSRDAKSLYFASTKTKEASDQNATLTLNFLADWGQSPGEKRKFLNQL